MISNRIDFSEIMSTDEVIEAEILGDGLAVGEKYRLKTADGNRYILKLFPCSFLSAKEYDYCQHNDLEKTGLPMQHFLRVGLCCGGTQCFELFSWIQGRPVSDVLSSVKPGEQFEIGIKSGKLLKRIHKTEVFRYEHELLSKRATDCLRRFELLKMSGRETYQGDIFADYLRKADCDRVQQETCVLHGDYHTKNLIFDLEGNLYPIDWIYGRRGDPAEDFARIFVSLDQSIEYCRGQLVGYFDGWIPSDFWYRLQIITSIHQLELLEYDMLPLENGITVQERQQEIVLKQYAMMAEMIPYFYREVTQNEL